MTLFCDMDGVLADFDKGYFETFGIVVDREKDNVDWNLVRNQKDFFLNLPPMPDFRELWDFIEKYEPIILTGVPSDVPEAVSNKLSWIHKNIGDHVEVRCCKSRNKYKHAIIGDILIDDWMKYMHKWCNAGGVWITHTSAKNTISMMQILSIQGIL